MGSDRQGFWHRLATAETVARREARIDFDYLCTSARSLVDQDSQEGAPTRVVDAFRELNV
jgi:hypothetical protein